MKILFQFILCLMLLIGSVYSQEIQSEFILSQGSGKIKEGDIFEATLRFWPIENASLDQFKVLEKTSLFNSLYLMHIISLGTSQNNADVVELKGQFIASSHLVQPTQTIKYNNQLIELKAGSLTVEELKNKTTDFYVADQSLNESKLGMILAGLLLIMVIICIVKRKALQDYINSFKKNSAKNLRKKYSELFRNAQTREDFEFIYKEKERWLSMLDVKAPAHVEFLKTLNQHQFKKEWKGEDYSEVKAAFEPIRRSFEK